MKKIAIVLALVLILVAAVTMVTACKEKYDLVYANWNLGTEALNNVERQMVQEFEKANNVKIKLLDIGSTGYDDGLTAAIARGNAPDVFMISNTNYVLNAQYALDLTDLSKNDPDWAKIPGAIEEAVHYKNGIYAIPFQMHMEGFFVNTTLLENEGLELPKDGNYTYEWFKDAVKQITADADNHGIIGLNSESDLFLWYPSAVNKDLGFYTWDGSQYHLDSPEFAAGIAEAKDFRNQHLTFDGMTEQTAESPTWSKYFAEEGGGVVKAWNDGNVAFRWGQSYEAPDMLEMNKGDFNVEFIGIPYVSNSEAEHKRTESFSILIGDYVSIYKDTTNPELAYKFAKWMSFDPAGISKRIELAGEGEVPNTLPMTTDEATVDKYFDIYPVDGVKQMYDRLNDAIIEGVKVVPGYGGARWNAMTGYPITLADGTEASNSNIGQFLDACWSGMNTDFTPQRATAINDLANKQYNNAVSKYENKYN